MKNCSSLFDYYPYNNYDDRFDPYLESVKEYRNKIAFKDTFYE